MLGIIWATLSGLGFGLFQTTNRRAGQHIDAYRGTFALLFISAILLTVASLTTQDLSLLTSAPLIAIASFALAGLIHFYFGWTFFSISQHQIGAARTGAVVGATPLFALIIAALTLGETPTPAALVGILLIVAGVYLVSS